MQSGMVENPRFDQHPGVVQPRPSSLLILVRDGEQGLEVFMLRRNPGAAFAPGAYVFPGGVLDAGDRLPEWSCDNGMDDGTACRQLGIAESGLAYWVAAVRECFEESGLLLAVREDGELLDMREPAVAAHYLRLRRRLNAGEIGFADLCHASGVRPALNHLTYFSHWITPVGSPRRYDTRCFIAAAPSAQAPLHDDAETVGHAWVRPADALDRHKKGELSLVHPTVRTLEQLTAFDTAAQALAQPRPAGSIKTIMPRRAISRAGSRVVEPDHAAYAEIGRVDPEGRGLAYCEIIPGVPMQIAPGVWRLTAHNPGYMTGPGTNTYLIGDATEALIIDPGPDDETHVRALLEHAPGPVKRVLVTHTHIDHSPAARALKEHTGATLIGLPPPATGQDQTFKPDHRPRHGEILPTVAGPLKVLHTPGHAANHLCYLLQRDRLLFTGDHIMQGSTVVVSPPDGDMQQYLDTLEALLQEDIGWLAPAHGFTMHEPEATIRGLIKHRLHREKLILQALRSRGPAALETLLPRVYIQLPEPLMRVAARSLRAHLIRLERCGEVIDDAGVWRLPDQHG